MVKGKGGEGGRGQMKGVRAQRGIQVDLTSDTERFSDTEWELGPMKSTWQCYVYDRSPTSKSWNDMIQKAWSARESTEFWSYFEDMKLPSELDADMDIYIFKKNLPPEWEHPAHRKGGKWVVSMDRNNPRGAMEIDYMWQKLVAYMTEEALQDDGILAGVVLTSRRQFRRISIWGTLNHTTDLELIQSITVQLRNVLALSPSISIDFFPHLANKKIDKNVLSCSEASKETKRTQFPFELTAIQTRTNLGTGNPSREHRRR
mmetsp:Transcript_21280/g.33575  ORF Transcript_21280/g.33575 Transcript_21280/m.33575 type:complete len:260 (-) Transcript_21280:143-922(-)